VKVDVTTQEDEGSEGPREGSNDNGRNELDEDGGFFKGETVDPGFAEDRAEYSETERG
jgi:hypothetical protein